MAFRLASFMKRKGSSNRYDVERIPTTMRTRADGLSFLVQIGGEAARCVIAAKTTTIRLSLRTMP